MPFPRASGILLHPTSLPGRFGIGDLGAPAHRFVDFLYESGQQLWQVLPLGPTGHGNSPYMCYSAMAGNPLLISPDLLQEQGWLTTDDLNAVPDFPADWVDYDQVAHQKLPLLQKAAQQFRDTATIEQRQGYDAFCAGHAFWLNDYALFMALKGVFDGKSWHQWEGAIARREPAALDHWRTELKDEIFYQKFFQFEFHRQWGALKHYANDSGIQIIGDIPIYVAHDSVDVWAFPHLFYLDPETQEPSQMAGVPPDYFSATGQLWGNPIYHWEQLEKTNFDWWIERFQAALEVVDIVRIDHFRGFCAYWSVPHGEDTAMNGEWIEGPGERFFKVLAERLGKLPIIAEDLGVITQDVTDLRDTFHFPGMKVLHFAFGGGASNPFLPFNHDRNFIVYTGTHDNDTTQGWFQAMPDHEREALMRYIGCTTADGIHWDMIRLAMASVANQAVFPLQDVLGFGSDTRMNYPGTAEGNWGWRYQEDWLTGDMRDRLLSFTETFGRIPHDPSPRRQRQNHPQPEPQA